MKIVQEDVFSNKTKMQDLMVKHWEEVALNKGLMKLSPDYDRYEILNKAGVLLGLFAYEGEEIIGYSINVILNHLHYKDLKMCQNDLLYLTPEKRNSKVGILLIKETERVAKELGCEMMLWHAKQGTALDKLLPRMGCQVQDIIYSKGI